jgi:hypothetical protein
MTSKKAIRQRIAFFIACIEKQSITGPLLF